MSGWAAASKLIGNMMIRKVPALDEWFYEWTEYIEYDSCMQAMLDWEKQNKKYGQHKGILQDEGSIEQPLTES